jgi:hypothetical protein
MSGGGGGGSTGVMDTSYQDNINRDKRMQAERDAETKRYGDEKVFSERVADAVLRGRDTGREIAASRGQNPDEFAGVIESIVRDARARVPELDSNPYAYFTSDIFDTGFAKEEQNRVRAATDKVNKTFTPGFERSLVADTSDDAILDAILGEQRGTAQKQLEYNQKRGVINDIGFNTGMDRFKGQEAAGRSSLGSIGDAVLGKIRGGISDIRGEAGTAASQSGFAGANFDPSSYWNRANTYAAEQMGDLEGKVRASVGSTNFFDIPAILAAAGTAQGPINVTTSKGTDGTPGFDAKKSKTNRGLGSTGEF